METVKSGRLTRSAAADSALYQTAPNETAQMQTALSETALMVTALADSALMETALSSVTEPVLPSALKSPQLGRLTCRCSTLFHFPTIRVSDPDPHWFAFIWVAWSGSRRTKNDPQIEKSKEISRFEVLDVLFCGLKASPVAWAWGVEA